MVKSREGMDHFKLLLHRDEEYRKSGIVVLLVSNGAPGLTRDFVDLWMGTAVVMAHEHQARF